MGVESEMWGNEGGLHTLEFNGKTYHARLIDGTVKSEFEKRMFARARAVEDAMRELRGEEAYQKRLDELANAYLAGEFDLISPRGLQYVKTLSGTAFLMSLLIGCPEKEVYGIALSKQAEVMCLLTTIIKESFPGFDPFKVKEAPKGTAQDVVSALAAPLTTKELTEGAQGPK